jgi:hypothetical protein
MTKSNMTEKEKYEGDIKEIKKVTVLVETKSGVHQLQLTKNKTTSLIGFLALLTNYKFEISEKIEGIKHL